jgi:CheY-like chemotaxis protein
MAVLVVDDDIATCLIMRGMIQKLGFDCDIVHDGQQAIKAASAKQYIVIFLDSFMPDKNGWAAALEIQKPISGIEGPLLVGMMSWCESSLIQKWKSAGIDCLLLKPVNRSDVNNILRTKIKLSSAHTKTELDEIDNRAQSTCS